MEGGEINNTAVQAVSWQSLLHRAQLEEFSVRELGKYENGVETKTFVIKSRKYYQNNGRFHQVRIEVEKYTTHVFPATIEIPNNPPVFEIGRNIFLAGSPALHESVNMPLRISIRPVTGETNNVQLRIYGYIFASGFMREWDIKLYKVKVDSILKIKIYENRVRRVLYDLTKDNQNIKWLTDIKVYDSDGDRC